MTRKAKGFYYNQNINYAGRHIILDFWGVKNINSVSLIRRTLTQTVKACGATLLKIDLHKFSPQGVSGMALIAESHISIHTWPEYQYVAIDVFTCGSKVDPDKAISSLKKSLKPKKVQILEIKRGLFE